MYVPLIVADDRGWVFFLGFSLRLLEDMGLSFARGGFACCQRLENERSGRFENRSL
jgi:hypothetical protein